MSRSVVPPRRCEARDGAGVAGCVGAVGSSWTACSSLSAGGGAGAAGWAGTVGWACNASSRRCISSSCRFVSFSLRRSSSSCCLRRCMSCCWLWASTAGTGTSPVAARRNTPSVPRLITHKRMPFSLECADTILPVLPLSSDGTRLTVSPVPLSWRRKDTRRGVTACADHTRGQRQDGGHYGWARTLGERRGSTGG